MPAEVGQELRVPAVGQAQVRVQLDRALVVPLRLGPLPGVALEVGKRVVRLGVAGVELDCFPRCRFRSWEVLLGVQHVAADEAAVDVGQVGISRRAGRIEGDGLAEVLTRSPAVVRAAPGTMQPTLQEQLVGPGVGALLGGQPLLLAGGEAYPQLVGDLAGDLRLHREDVGRLPTVLLAPDLSLVARVDQLHADREVLAVLQEFARHDAAHTQCARHLQGVGVLALVPHGGGVRDDLQARELRQAADQALADAIGQVLLLGVFRRACERQHGQRGDALDTSAEKTPAPGEGGTRRGDDDRGEQPEGDLFPPGVDGFRLRRPSLECGDHFRYAREPIPGLAGQAPQDHGLPTRVQVGYVGPWRRWQLLQPLDRRLEGGFSHERPATRDHLIEDHAQRVLIGGGRRRRALDLLWRHVGGGARDLAAGFVHGQRQVGAFVFRAALREAEVGDDEAHVLARRGREHHVLGLEVAVHDPRAMRGRESRPHLPCQNQRVGSGEPPLAPETIAQGLAMQELHGEEQDVCGRCPGFDWRR